MRPGARIISGIILAKPGKSEPAPSTRVVGGYRRPEVEGIDYATHRVFRFERRVPLPPPQQPRADYQI